MDNLIKKMHDGELFPMHTIASQDKEYKDALDRVCELEQKILDTYPDIAELLNEFQSAQFELEKMNTTQEFVDGFKVGARMIIEILNSIE